jgi:hypothetical protein
VVVMMMRMPDEAAGGRGGRSERGGAEGRNGSKGEGILLELRQAWMDLGRIDRAQFLQRLREVYAEERAARRAANGTVHRGPPISLMELSVSAADLAG